MASAYDEELKRQLGRLPRLRSDLIREILKQLGLARGHVLYQLAQASPERGARLKQQLREIEAAIGRFQRDAGKAAERAVDDTWRAGVELLTSPASAAGLQLAPLLRIDDRQLRAMRLFLTGKIKDVAVQAVDRINGVLAQVLIGTTPMSEAITAITDILDGPTRSRAMTIAYTEIGRVYSAASYEALVAGQDAGVPMAKRWIKSGKVHPRPSHVDAHNQLRRVQEPFEIINTKTGEVEKLRYPRDPNASPGNTINCGCMMVPVVNGSAFGKSVIVIPEDPTKPVRKVPRARYEAKSEQLVGRVDDRLRRFLQAPIDAPGLRVVHTGNATPLLGDESDPD